MARMKPEPKEAQRRAFRELGSRQAVRVSAPRSKILVAHEDAVTFANGDAHRGTKHTVVVIVDPAAAAPSMRAPEQTESSIIDTASREELERALVFYRKRLARHREKMQRHRRRKHDGTVIGHARDRGRALDVGQLRRDSRSPGRDPSLGEISATTAEEPLLRA
jgi:hypothetical protein